MATRFLIISDTHDLQLDETVNEASRPLQLPTPKADVLLHCGDLTQVGGVSSFKKALKMLGSIEAELKLIIAGNHDLELDQKYWEIQCNDEDTPENPEDHDLAVHAMTGPDAREAGVLFLDEGTHAFTLKNGTRFTMYVSPYTPAFGDWAFAYKSDEDRYNKPSHTANGVTSIATNPIPEGVDIVMTHGPPKGILDMCPQGNVGCQNLRRALHRTKPQMHCFGHIHEGYGIEVVDWNKTAIDAPKPRKNEAIHQFFERESTQNPYPEPFAWRRDRKSQTLAINASIMTGDHKPANAPWLVSLDLPRPSQ
ncbi:hypothetical protein G7Y79_00021g050540 [Physcia stellaris]|nr:hypothetical protein G7Y79_00021g050540 [Physcia stellaris]